MTHRISRRTLLTVATASALGAALLLSGRTCLAASLASVDVYDVSARAALPVYSHHGRRYVAGTPGNEYAVRIRNCSGRRMLAVVSVDGVNVITGETAAPSQSGYVIEPGDYVNIDGWRKSLADAAAFYFTDPTDAYASRTGRPDDLGVIGVAVFLENPPPPPVATLNEAYGKAERSAAADAAAAPAPTLGTGHGRRVDSPAQYVAFERASDRPDEVVRIRYERPDRLAALGVLPRPPRPMWSREPDPFPADRGFVPDP